MKALCFAAVAIAFAQNRQYSFLLLDGIPDYYQQYGFIDVIEDMPQHAVGQALIPVQPKTIYHCWLSIKMANLRDIYSYQGEEDSLGLLRLRRTPGQPYRLCCVTRIL